MEDLMRQVFTRPGQGRRVAEIDGVSEIGKSEWQLVMPDEDAQETVDFFLGADFIE